jgi:hypothetical protein
MPAATRVLPPDHRGEWTRERDRRGRPEHPSHSRLAASPTSAMPHPPSHVMDDDEGITNHSLLSRTTASPRCKLLPSPVFRTVECTRLLCRTAVRTQHYHLSRVSPTVALLEMFNVSLESASSSPLHMQVGPSTASNFPLQPAYATTFNGCQGLTLDKTVLDLRCDVFVHGQLYTALSCIRVRGDSRMLFRTIRTIMI